MLKFLSIGISTLYRKNLVGLINLTSIVSEPYKSPQEIRGDEDGHENGEKVPDSNQLTHFLFDFII